MNVMHIVTRHSIPTKRIFLRSRPLAAALIGVCSLIPYVSSAQQPEPTAFCDEGGVPPISEPVPMGYGDHTNGCVISPATDSDSFIFFGTAGDQVKFVVLGLTGNFGPSIQVRDPMGDLILDGDVDGASCQPGFNGICSFSSDVTLSKDGSYFIVVSDRGSNNTGSFTMQLERLFPGPGIERLSYDSLAVVDGRVTQVIDESSVNDDVSPQTDFDHYFLSAVAGTSIRFNVLGLTGNFGPLIEVRDPTGAVVLNGDADGASCQPGFNGICSFSVDLLPLVTGTYTVALGDRGSNNAGNYLLSLWCIVGDCDNDGDGIADVRRTSLRYGESVSMPTITPQVDGDSYVFMGTPGDQVQFTVLGQTGNFGPRIEVRNPAGASDPLVAPVLNGEDHGAFCQPGFNGICSFSVGLLPSMTGAYTLILHDRGINNSGNYQLTLECLFSPGDLVCENLPGRFPTDVPENYWAFTFIESLADNGITSGCATDSYCPLDPVTRGQMSVFIERGINGGNFQAPACQGDVFADVGTGNIFCGFIEQFFADGITSGCALSLYCPEDSVTRAQMAVFLLRAKFGANHVPPVPTGVFSDVPVDFWAAAWIEELAAEGITAGCGEGIYCPNDAVTRDQMAVFVVRTFALGQ